MAEKLQYPNRRSPREEKHGTGNLTVNLLDPRTPIMRYHEWTWSENIRKYLEETKEHENPTLETFTSNDDKQRASPTSGRKANANTSSLIFYF